MSKMGFCLPWYRRAGSCGPSLPKPSPKPLRAGPPRLSPARGGVASVANLGSDPMVGLHADSTSGSAIAMLGVLMLWLVKGVRCAAGSARHERVPRAVRRSPRCSSARSTTSYQVAPSAMPPPPGVGGGKAA